MIIKTLFFLFLTTCLFSQQFSVAVLNNISIGNKYSERYLDSIITRINNLDNIKLVVINGNLTSKGSNSEFDLAKSVLEKLNKEYYFIPGTNDQRWNESGGLRIIDNWDEQKFISKENHYTIIGLNSSFPKLSFGGHFSPEIINWLRAELTDVPISEPIILILPHNIKNGIDNWYKIQNIIGSHNIKAIISSNNEKYKFELYNKVPYFLARPLITDRKKDSFGFNLFNFNSDTLIVSELRGAKEMLRLDSLILSETINLPRVDSSSFINKSAKILWRKNLRESLISEPTIYKNRIITVTRLGFLSCFDSSGKFLWDYDAFGDVFSKPTVADGTVALATLQGDIQTIKLINGEQIQSLGFDEPITSDLVTIDYKGNKKLMIPKVKNSSKAIIAGTSSGKLYCFDLETLEEIWVNKNAKGMIETKPLVIGNYIYFGSRDGKFYCIDSRNGLLLWKWKVKKDFYSAPADCQPVTDGKSIFLTTTDGYVYSIDALTGSINWHTKKYKAFQSIGISENRRYLYIKETKKTLWIISANKGLEFNPINVKYGNDYSPTKPIQKNGIIIFSTSNGNVYRINKKYYYKTLFFMGNSKMHSIQQISNQKYIASNIDGEITVFEYEEK